MIAAPLANQLVPDKYNKLHVIDIDTVNLLQRNSWINSKLRQGLVEPGRFLGHYNLLFKQEHHSKKYLQPVDGECRSHQLG